jgi:hypothetical protein
MKFFCRHDSGYISNYFSKTYSEKVLVELLPKNINNLLTLARYHKYSAFVSTYIGRGRS